MVGAFRIFTIWPWALVLLVLVAGCSDRETSKSAETTLMDSTRRPDSEVGGARIYLYDRGQITTEILADKIFKFEINDSTMGYELAIQFFDSTGGIASTVVGDSGVIRENQGHLQIYGHVVVVSQDSSRLETDYLSWNPRTRRIQTDAFVRITDIQGNVITGWGMEADRNLGRIKILRHVSGTVRETEGDIQP